MTERELIQLCVAARDNTLSPEKFAELEEILRNDPKARETYLRLSQVESLLESCPPVASPAEQKAPRFQTRLLAWCALASALAVAATILTQSLFTDPAEEQVAVAPSLPVATLIFAEACEWNNPAHPVEGARLHPGHLGITSGTAVIRFDGGAEMLLNGQSTINLLTGGSGEVLTGNVVVRAEEGAEGFTLGTPQGKVVDLGTEFAVKVESSGASEVHVLDGEVAYGDRRDQKVLRAGKALRFENSGSTPKEITVNSPRFAEAVQKAGPRPRADLMLAYEGFNYAKGQRKIRQCKGGKGWASPWRLRNDSERLKPFTETSPSTMNIVDGKMKVTWPVAGGRLGMLAFEKEKRTILVRNLAKKIPMDRDGVYFFSMMVREPNPPSGKKNEVIRLTLRDSRDYFGQALSFGYGSKSKPQIEAGAGLRFTSPLAAPRGQSTLWVGKIVSRKHGEDEFYFRIYGENETLDYAEPATWHIASRGILHSAQFDCVLLTNNGSERIIDEVRIGPSWRSVAPLPDLPSAP